MSGILPIDAPDTEFLREIGRRLEALRKSRGLTQSEAAERSGLARRTVYGAEHGDNPTLLTVLRLLRTYGRLGAIDAFVPVPEVSPLEVIERRERAGRGRRG